MCETRYGAPVCILVEPQLGENIGAAARAMANFDLSEMRLVAPRDGWPSETARKSASGAIQVVDQATIFPDTQTAVADLHFIAATTARPRDMAKPVLSLEAMATELRVRCEAGQRTGVLFGPERTGLHNDHVALADAIAMAPVNPHFASLNLAQAVLLLAYEWMRAARAHSLGRKTAFDGLVEAGPQHRKSHPASKAELMGFFEQLETELDASGFLRPREKRAVMVRNLRNMFTKMSATEQEVRTLRGIVASLTRAHRPAQKAP